MTQDFSPKPIEELIAELNRGIPSPEEYTAKFNALVSLAADEVPQLLEILLDPNRPDDDRLLVIQILTELKDARALPALIETLAMPSLEPWLLESFKAFGEICVQPLATTLLDYSQPVRVRAKIAKILGELEDRQAVEPLITVLQNAPTSPLPDYYVSKRDQLQQGMEQIKASLEALNAFFKKYPQLSSSLESYFLVGMRNPTADLSDPYATPEFASAFDRAAKLVMHEPNYDAATTEALELMGGYFESEVAHDIVKFLAVHRQVKPGDNEGNENLVRAEAAEALGKLGDARAVDALLVALEDQSVRVRISAVTAFYVGEFKDNRAKSLLLALTGNDNTELGEWATRALSLFSDEASQEEFATLEGRLYQGDRWQRYTTASTLAKMGEAGLEILLTALTSDQSETVTATMSSVAFSYNPKAAAALAAKLNDPLAEVRAEAARALGYYAHQKAKEDKTPVSALLSVVENPLEEPQVLKEVVTTLGWFEDEVAVAPLIKMLRYELENPPQKPKSEEPYNEAVAQKLMARGELRDALVQALTQLKAKGAVDLIIKLATDKTELDFRRAKAVRSLGQIGDEGGFGTVLEALKDSEAEVREAAVVALGYFGDPRGFEPLVEAFYNDTRLVPVRAITSLGMLKDSRSWEHLVKALAHPDGLIRYSAARGLGEFGDGRAIPLLIETLGDPDPEVRFEAAEALGKLKAREAMPLLAKLAESDKADVCFCCHNGATVAEAAETALEAIEA